MNKILLLACLIGLCVDTLPAQEATARGKGFFDAQINPVYPFLGGFGAKGYYNFPRRWSVGLIAEGAFTLPEFAQEAFFTHAGSIDVHWDYAIGPELRYRFRREASDIRGFYALLGVGYEQWSVAPEPDQPRLPGTAQTERFTNGYAGAGAGFNWMPFRRRGLYLSASYGWIFILNGTGSRTVNGQPFSLRPHIPPSFAPALALGWRFARSVHPPQSLLSRGG